MITPRTMTDEEREANVVKFFVSMRPFEDADDIPSIPKVNEKLYRNVIIPNLVRCGAIPKKDLKDGAVYEGSCRNASKAIWDSKTQTFTYLRHKFGSSYEEEINHFEDDDGYDLFVPIKLKYSNPN